MKNKNYLISLLVISPFIQSCNVDFNKIEKKAAMINHYEDVSLKLASENRELHADVKRLEFELEKAKEENRYYQHKYGEAKTVAENAHGNPHGESQPAHGEAHGEVHGETHGEAEKSVAIAESHAVKSEEHVKREVASVAPVEKPASGTDYVEFKTYKWHADDMMQIADKEFKEKHYEKAAQFYYSLIQNYPHYKGINDEFYFKAGIASYESGVHHAWTIDHFEALMKTYPTSQYYRSAKLWVALTNLKIGEKKKFFATVEEFRKKYRNTNEWKILSSYYEKIEEKTNE